MARRSGAGPYAPIVASPGALVDVGASLQAAFDSSRFVQLQKNGSYLLSTAVFLDAVTNEAKYILDLNGSTLTLDAALPKASTWNTAIGAAPPTAFFNGTLRSALSGSTVTTDSTTGASSAPFGTRLIIKNGTIIGPVAGADAACVIFGGTASNGTNGAAAGLENVTLERCLAGISWSGYADGSFAEGVEVGANPSGKQTYIIWQPASGDGTRLVKCKAYGGYICDLRSSNGFKVESCVSGQVNIVTSTGEIVVGHQETDENASAVAFSINIDRSRVSILDTYTRLANNATHYSIVINDALTTPLYVASEVSIRGWRSIANYVASQGDAAKGPGLHITALNKGGRVQVENTRGVVVVAGVSVGWQSTWVDSADGTITTALAAGADYIATGNWVLSYANAWSVGPLGNARPQPRALAAPTVAGAVDTTVTGATLVNATTYEYIAAVVTQEGGYGPLSAAVQVAAGTGGAIDLTLTNPVGACTIILWRKTGAGVAATPDHYITIGLDAYQTIWVDTGVNINGRPWLTASIPVPNTVASTGPQWVFPSLMTDLLVRKTADVGLANQATLQNDADLKFAMAASATYVFEALIDFDGATTGDMKYSFTVPTGSTIKFGGNGPFTAATGTNGSVTYGVATASGASAGNVGAAGAGTRLMLRVYGIVIVGSTAGLLQFQWAQATSDATATTVYTNSFLLVRRVA